MSREDASLPVPRYPPLSRRQYVLCLLAGGAGCMAARYWLLPEWVGRVEAGTATLARALDQAVSETVGVALACAALALFACTMFNLVRRERQRRADMAARELAFVTSLGHSVAPFSPSNEAPRR